MEQAHRDNISKAMRGKMPKYIPNNKGVIRIEKIYKIIDSFLTEAKDQYGKERSLERLNQDRHLAAERFEELLEAQCKEVIEEIEKMKKYPAEDQEEGGEYDNGFDQALQEVIDKLRK